MSGKYALIIGNTEYIDPGLAQLTAPGKDAEDFARVLKDQNLCAFDEVKVLLNQSSSSVIEAVDEFFDQKKPDDLLVLYFSGHGVRDEFGSLYLAFKNTIRSRLRSTAIKDDYVRGAMDQSRSKRQVVVLDCCNSGAFPQGTKAETGGVMGFTHAFQGYGRFVLTASDATQFAWEGDKVIGETDNSLFTHFIVQGLEGEADLDGDGTITVDELYDYAYEQISKVTSKQTPTKSASKVEGDIVLRQFTRIEDIKPVALPDDLISEIDDTRPYVREVAVQKLEKIIRGKNIGLARSAREALAKIIADENTTRRVAQAAKQILQSANQGEQLIAQKTTKTVSNQKANGGKEGIGRESSQAIWLARESEQHASAPPVVPLVQTTERKIQAQQVKRPETSKLMFSVIGITLILSLCLGGGWVAFRYIFPPTIGTTFEVPTNLVATTATSTEIPPTLTFTPPPSASPTVTPFSPLEPDQFIIFYFDTVIIQKDFTKGWALLTPDYQTVKAKGWATYTTFWGSVKSWTYSNIRVEYNNNTKALVLITYTLFYDNNTDDVVPNVRYCLLWEPSSGTWQIDLRENCP
jgi:hypothetical protein